MATPKTCAVCWRKAVQRGLCLDHNDELLLLTLIAADLQPTDLMWRRVAA